MPKIRDIGDVVSFAATTAVLLLISALGAPGAPASDVGTLIQFAPNTTARASEVNQNFNDVKTAVNSKLDETVGSCPAGSSIRAIAPNGVVTCEVDDVGVGGGGDITGVIAGTGLAGGGLSGDVTLSVGTGAITAAHLGTASVASDGIANGSVTDADVSASAAIAITKIAGDAGFEVGGFWSNSNVPATPTSLGSIAVSAPGPGEILLFMGGTALLQDEIVLNFGIGTSPTAYTVYQSTGIVGSAGNVTSFHPMAAVLGYPVSSAGTYTFYALADKNDPLVTGNNANVSAVSLVAIFVPKRY